MTNKFIVGGVSAVVLVAASLSIARADDLPLLDGNIPICHATSSASNPYVSNSPNLNSIVKGNAHDEHHDPGDIIPAFRYKDGNKIKTYNGRNWTTENQAIHANGCAPLAPNPAPGLVDGNDDTPTQGEPGKGSTTPPQNSDSAPVVAAAKSDEAAKPVVPSSVEALPYTAGDHTLAYILIAAGLATIVTGIIVGINALYQRFV